SSTSAPSATAIHRPTACCPRSSPNRPVSLTGIVTKAPTVLSIPYREAAAAFRPLAARDMAVLLDSALPGAQGRYSYIAADPFKVIRCTAQPWTATVDGARRDGDAFTVLAEELTPFRHAHKGPTPFTGGAVGFFSYELGGMLERLPAPKTT